MTPHGIEIIDPYDLGVDELLDSGMSRDEVELELCAARGAALRRHSARSCRPSSRSAWPTTCAPAGIELVVDPEAFATRGA